MKPLTRNLGSVDKNNIIDMISDSNEVDGVKPWVDSQAKSP